MRMDTHFAHQKFKKAVRALSTDLPLGEKIISAVSESLIHIHNDDLPDSIAKDFRKFMDNLSRVEPKNDCEGKIRATVNSLSKKRLTEVAAKIIYMHDFYLERSAHSKI
jgi:hypothetical protein